MTRARGSRAKTGSKPKVVAAPIVFRSPSPQIRTSVQRVIDLLQQLAEVRPNSIPLVEAFLAGILTPRRRADPPRG
jgi:hypothetical protein